MSKLHDLLLDCLEKFSKQWYLNDGEGTELNRLVEVLIQEIKNIDYDINEKDEKGNTLLSLVNNICEKNIASYGRGAYVWGNIYEKLINACMERGANPIIKNKDGKTAIDICLSNNDNDYNRLVKIFFDSIQSHFPDEKAIIEFLNELGKKKCSPYLKCGSGSKPAKYGDIGNTLNLNRLPLHTIKCLLEWVNQIISAHDKSRLLHGFSNLESAKQFKKEVLGQIQLLEHAIDLPFIINEFIELWQTNQKTILRAMLLNDSPLTTVLNQLCDDDLLSLLPETLRQSFEKIIAVYKNKRILLDELSATPSPLTEEERKTINPIYDRLDVILYRLEPSYSDKEWKERAKNAEDPNPVQRIEDIYNNQSPEDLKMRKNLCQELNGYKKAIKTQSYLGQFGLYAKNSSRHHCATAAESRLSNSSGV